VRLEDVADAVVVRLAGRLELSSGNVTAMELNLGGTGADDPALRRKLHRYRVQQTSLHFCN
jgi:hypothetical protein